MNLKSFTIISLMTTLCISATLMIVPSDKVFIGNNPDDYARVYAPVAHNLICGKGFTQNGVASLEYPPGYSIFLACVFGISEKFQIPENYVLNAFKLVFMLMANLAMFLISRLIWNNERKALLASVLWITYPLLLWNTVQRNSEILFLPIFYFGIYFFVKLHLRSDSNKQALTNSIYTGILIGLSSLVRPIAVFVPAILSVLYLLMNWKTKPLILRNIFCILAAYTIVILPWEFWAYKQTGKVIMLSNNGVGSIYDGLTFGVLDIGYRKGIPLTEDVKNVMRDIVSHGRCNYTNTKDIAKQMLHEFRKDPAAVIKLYCIKALRVWYGTNSNRFEDKIILIQFIYMVFWLLSIWKIRTIIATNKIAVYFLGLVAYFWLMAIIALPIVRYIVPTLGLLFVFSPAILEYRAVNKLDADVIKKESLGKD